MNGDDSQNWKLGYLYESYICRLFTGDINKEITSLTQSYYSDTTIQEKYIFSNGKYEYYVTSDTMNNYLISEGTYITENNKVICKGNNMAVDEFTFLIENDKIYLVLLEKK